MLKALRALVAAGLVALSLAAAPQAVHAQAVQLPPGEQCFQATTGLNGMIGLLGTITAGAGGTSGTYTAALTGGSGTGATAAITVSGGAVTAVQIQNPGAQYFVGDILSASSGAIGGVTGFSVPVGTVSINSSLAGGIVGMYVPGTFTVKQTWQDAAETILNVNPIGLDGNGCALIYGAGIYRQILKDSLGNTVWDQLTYAAAGSAVRGGVSGGTANVQTLSTGGFTATDGQVVDFIAGVTNTGTTTITPNGGSATPIVKDTSAGPVPLTGSEITTGNAVSLIYQLSGNQFHIVNPALSGGTTIVTAASCGVVADGLTDDTAAWNTCIAIGNATPNTTILASAGTSTVSTLTAMTKNTSIKCPGGPGACIISHSGNNALTWNGSFGGGLINMGLNNTGAACNSTILLRGSAQQLQFENLVLGTGIGTAATMGTSGSSVGGTSTWNNIYSPHGVANVACPLYNLVSGFGFIFQNSVVFVPPKGVSGRVFLHASMAAPQSWDAIQIQDNTLQYFWSIIDGTLTSAGLLLDAKVDGNFLDNCINPCFNIDVQTGSTISGFTISNNWMDNDVGLSDCLDFTSSTGSANIFGLQIMANRINGCGKSGIVVGGSASGVSVREAQINDNMIYAVNVANAGTTYGIFVEADGANGASNDIQINSNRVADDVHLIFPGNNPPTNGIAVINPVSGGPGTQGFQMVGNRATGGTANYVLPATATNSLVLGNIGLPSSTKSVTVTASPFTYTAGQQPETVYIRAGTLSLVVQNATTLCTTAPCVVSLSPNESFTVTYSVLPTINSVLH